MTSRVLLATRSPHKAAEIQRILLRSDRQIVTLADLGLEESAAEDEIENHPTFLGNALAKARYFAALTGEAVLADDSGLEVAALNNAPGVRTRRLAFDHGIAGLSGGALDRTNVEVLLDLLASVPDHSRGARYVCCAALVSSQKSVSALGTSTGSIARARLGDGGFGYDPVFMIPELNLTFAQLSPEQKDDRSHRARAFRAIASLF